MLKNILLFLVAASAVAADTASNSTTATSKSKQRIGGRVFSLFNVVKFQNQMCTATTTIESVHPMGTCFTEDECSDKGGKASGSCAAGFGVCCTFEITSTTSLTASQNNTYLMNPGYPSVYSATSSISYNVQKCSEDICFLRLDFLNFNIDGPTGSTELIASTGACPDTFTTTLSSGATVPVICGLNTDQHMYLDIGRLSSDTATLAFAFSGTSTTRKWVIKVGQIECSATYKPEAGCLQYFFETTGTLKTFHFDGAASTGHLPNQDYSVCLRKNAGFCCTQYTPCSDTLSFSLSYVTDATKAVADSFCATLDFVTIEGSSAHCNTNPGSAGMYNHHYCGHFLYGDDAIAVATTHTPICDCTAPFSVGILTNSVTDAGGTTVNAQQSRGVCLNYQQVPCA